MGAAHVKTLGSFLQAESGRRYYVTPSTRHFPVYDNHGTFQRNVEGVDASSPDQRFSLRSVLTTREVASMVVQSLPGCCGVCVVHSFRGDSAKVVEFIKIAVKAAKRAGYGQLLFTLKVDSTILDSFRPEESAADGDDGRIDWARFRNGKTNNLVTLVTIYLHQDEKQPSRSDTAGE